MTTTRSLALELVQVLREAARIHVWIGGNVLVYLGKVHELVSFFFKEVLSEACDRFDEPLMVKIKLGFLSRELAALE